MKKYILLKSLILTSAAFSCISPLMTFSSCKSNQENKLKSVKITGGENTIQTWHTTEQGVYESETFIANCDHVSYNKKLQWEILPDSEKGTQQIPKQISIIANKNEAKIKIVRDIPTGVYNIKLKVWAKTNSDISDTTDILIDVGTSVFDISYTLSEDKSYYIASASKYLNEQKKTSVEVPSTYQNKPIEEIESNGFKDCVYLENVNLNEGMENIGDYAFKGCTSLKSINLPENLNSLVIDCFQNDTSLNQVVIPSSVSVLPSGCFSDCLNLETLTIKNPYVVYDISANQLSSTALKHIYVCNNILGQYKQAQDWKQLSDKIEQDADPAAEYLDFKLLEDNTYGAFIKTEFKNTIKNISI